MATLGYKSVKISNGGKVQIAPKSDERSVAYVPDAVLNRVAAGSRNTKFKAAVKKSGGERAKALREIETDVFKLVDATVCKAFETVFAG